MNFELIFFFIVAAVAVGSAILMITRTNPVISVLYLIVNFFCLATMYLTLHAQFIAIIQILVYAGAIMVLFLFVIMLLNLGDETVLSEKRSLRRILATGLIAAAFFEIIVAIATSPHNGPEPAGVALANTMGTVETIGAVLYSRFLFPFEVTSMLLLAAMVGVIVLAKKKFD